MKIYFSQLNIVIFIFALIVIPSMKQGSAGFLYAQNVGINAAGASPNISAILDIDAQPGFNKGLLIPRVTYSQRIGANFNPLSAAAQGLTVYQTDAGGLGEGFYFNTSTSTTPAWSFLLNNTSGWSLTGNATTTPSTSAIGTAIAAGQNYVGTSDLKDFVLATNNLERLRINSAGNIGIGTSTPGTLLDVNGTTRALLYTFPAPTGDPAPVINTRTVPSGQGASSEKTELILFHGNDPANAAGADQITLRAPALSFQTFNDVNVLDMNNNTGYNERMYINSIGNVGIGTILPERLLHVAVTATDGVNGAVLNSYEIAQFKVHAGGGAKRGLEIGAPTGSIVSPVYLKVHGTSNRFAILNETNAEQFTILNSGNVGIGTAVPTQKLQVSGGNIIIDNTNWYYGLNTSGATQPLIRSRGMGYSPSTYPGLQLGQTGDNIALFIDPNSITGGAFNGNIENEIFLPNTASFRQANSGATDWISTMYLNNGNIGIGTTAPSTQLHTTGGVRFQTLTGTGNRFVITDLNGNISAGAAITAGIVTGSGTLNYVPKWTPNGTTLGNSSIFDNGTNVGIGTISPGAPLQVNGEIVANGLFGAVTGAPDNTIWGVSKDTYPTWGMFYNEGSPDYIEFKTGGTVSSRITLDDGSAHFGLNGGNVGIGNNSPQEKLDVRGSLATSISNTQVVGKLYNAASDGFLELYTGEATPISRIKLSAYGNSYFAPANNGNIGIGTTSPTLGKLNVVSSANTSVSALRIESSGTLANNDIVRMQINGLTNGFRMFQDGSSNVIYSFQDGNVGIGTTSPGAKLEIAGQIKITGGSPGINKVLTSDATGLASWQNSGGTPFSGSVTSGNWYRIASNPGNRCNAEFTLRDFISGGGHSTATFRVGTSYNYASGTSFTLLNHNQYGGATFTKVRVLQATTYDPQYLEVYVERTGSVEFSVYDNLQANGWVPLAWTAGGIPGGYTDREFNIDNLFVVGDSDDRLTINRGGNLGIGTTSPGSKLDVAGQIRIRNGNGIAFERDLGQSDYSTFVDAYGFPSQGYGAGGAANYWVRLASKGGTHIVLNTDGGAGSGENSFDHFTVWQGAVDGDKLFNVSNIGNTYIKGNLGIGTTSPTKKLQVTGGSLLSASILTDGYVQDVSGIVQGNYIPSQNWNIASGSVGVFNDNGGAGDNTREWGDGPDGNRAILWKGFGSGTDADGGWNTSVFDIDHTKSYRVSVWVKKTGVNSGTTYLGIQGSNVTYLNGVAEGNPYFFCGTPPKLDQWYLIVGYIHGSGDASLVGSGGLYDGSTGLKVINFGGLGNCGADYKFTTAATTQQQRAYLYYNNNSSARQYFFNPRFEEVNGKEIPIAALLGAPVMWQEFSTPLIKEFSFSGSGSQTITLPSSVPTNARYVLADIFVTANFSDHQNFVLGRSSLSAEKNWVDIRGQQPSSQFGNLARHSVTLTYFGEADGYSSNYGIWYSSQLVPVSGQTMYYQNYGNSGSTGWLYMVIRSYSN